jgi:hypothetical protein
MNNRRRTLNDNTSLGRFVLRFTRLFHIARLALNNNHSLHYLFTKHYVLWYFNNLMMFTYLKLSICVSSTGIKHIYIVLVFPTKSVFKH